MKNKTKEHLRKAHKQKHQNPNKPTHKAQHPTLQKWKTKYLQKDLRIWVEK